MRLTRLLLAAALVAPAPAVWAATAVDTTGTTYSTDRVVVPAFTYPVQGGGAFSDTFLTCRSGCSRKHMGQDLMGPKMTPLLAAFTGTVTSLKRESSVGQGNYLVIAGDNGWSAMYLHVNNDTPGTDDGRGTKDYAFPKGIEVGVRVLAGQVVAYRGDSGNAEGTGPHLHFELRKGSGWGGVVYNAFPTLVASRRLGRATPSGPHPEGSLLRGPDGLLWTVEDGIKHLVAPGLALGPAVPVTAPELRLARTGTPWARPAADLVTWEGRTYARDADGVLHLADRYALASWGWATATPVPWTPPVVEVPVVEVPVEVVPEPVESAAQYRWWEDEPTDLPTDEPTAEPTPEPVTPEIGAPLPLRPGTLVTVSGVGAAVIGDGVVHRLWTAAQAASYGYAGLPRLTVPRTSVAGWPVAEIASR